MAVRKVQKNSKSESLINRKAAPKEASRKPRKKTSTKKQVFDADNNNLESDQPNTVTIRMYCIGTGDCFILKFFDENGQPFTMMIDCGCCVGTPEWFEPYIKDLAEEVKGTIDLLVITHEHLDHVNGFQKWEKIFKDISFREAWFAWTENPHDPGGDAAELLKKRMTMRKALDKAINTIKKRGINLERELNESAFKNQLLVAHQAFINGLDSLGTINLGEVGEDRDELAGLKAIKNILHEQGTKIRYLGPGDTVVVDGMPGIKFHVLGPPRCRDFIFKDGKEGTDVFRKNMTLNESTLAARAFDVLATKNPEPEDIPFTHEYIVGPTRNGAASDLMTNYSTENWRNIEDEWLLSAGSLAIRLNSHINNTSLVLAIESVKSEKVLLMPGDAEYGSWESWHLIENWNKKGKNGKHLVEDLLNRTVFYKVGHHLSYNGTALEKGINMMASGDLVAMATLDRNRISKGWKSTMPNPHLLKELIRKTGGRFFIMNESEVDNPPSLTLDPTSLGQDIYREVTREDGAATLYKQYKLAF